MTSETSETDDGAVESKIGGIKARDGMGRAFRSPEQVALDHRAAQMRSASRTYQQIADALGISKAAAFRSVQRAIDDIPKEDTELALKIELEKLDAIERRLLDVLVKRHLRTSPSGKVVMHDGEPVYDDGPAIQAAAAMLRVNERRSRLLGLNAPTVTKADVMIYDVERDTQRIIDAQMAALRMMGLDDKADEFKSTFVAALGSGEDEVVDAEWTPA